MSDLVLDPDDLEARDAEGRRIFAEDGGAELLVLDLRHLLEVKRRAGRAKDMTVLPLIEHALALGEEE